MSGIRRREFVILLGGSAATAWPVAARAQQGGRDRRIGVLMGFAESDPEAQTRLAAFREGLQKLGWTERRNIRIDTRWAGLDVDAMQRFAKELVALQPDVILTHTTPATLAVHQETRAIPIVFVQVADPVASGFVASFSRPGGNVTGFTTVEPTMGGKWLEVLKEIAPRVARAAVLLNPATAPYSQHYLNPFKSPLRPFGVEPIVALFTMSPRSNPSFRRKPGSRMAADRAAGYLYDRPGGSLPIPLPPIRSVTSLKSEACCPMEMTRSIWFGGQRRMPIAFSRARTQPSFRSRPQPSSNW